MGNKRLAMGMTQVVQRAIAIGITVACGGLVEALKTTPAQGAEEIRIILRGPLAVSVSVESLENLAETGEIPPELRAYSRFFNDGAFDAAQRELQRRFNIDVVTASRLTYSPLGRDVIAQAGEYIRTAPNINGFYGIRAAVINAAAKNTNEAGWTLIDVLNEFPTETIEIKVGDILSYWKWFRAYLNYDQAMIDAIQTVADQEAIAQTTIQPAELPNLSQPGTVEFEQKTITVTNPVLRQSAQGLTVNYDYDVDVYVPQGLSQPAPIVMISHGFGSRKENFLLLAEHLASHGFVVMIPDHVGSDLTYRQNYLRGGLSTLLSPSEFLARPQEISFLIDELERLVATNSDWASVLDLNEIGVMGDSFGATTVYSLAGAEFNFNRLAEQCQNPNRLLNFAMYIQCRAEFLPNTQYDLKDDRIRAAIITHGLGYGLFGPEELANIEIPFLMVAGSNDLVAPVVTEQFYPFMWLGSPTKYLALLTRGTHFSTKPEGAAGASVFPAFLRGENAEFGQAYARALTVAFWNRYLRGDASYDPYLTAAYGHYLSADTPMALDIIQSLTADEIETAYGDRPFIPIEQASPSAIAEEKPPSVLADIAERDILRVALRRDAPPFGFLNTNDQWDGYCVDFVNGLRSHLEQQLSSDVAIEIVELPSTLENRFDLVRDGDVHLECGPNTIRPVDGVSFSQPIFVAATRFLIPANPAERIDFGNPTNTLSGVTLGVLPNTTTATFLENRYPDATIVYFDGVEGREQGVQAVADGAIAAFAGDDILTIGEVNQLGLDPSAFRLVPELPLTCEFYGVLLPEGDDDWRRTVNQFITTFNEGQTLGRWFRDLSSVELNNLQNCLNR